MKRDSVLKQVGNILTEGSEIEHFCLNDLRSIIDIALDHDPYLVFLTGSSIDNSNYGDIDIVADYEEPGSIYEAAESLEDCLSAVRIYGTEETSRSRNQLLVSGALGGQDYDIFLRENPIMRSDKELVLYEK
jgi:hypothetical protein